MPSCFAFRDTTHSATGYTPFQLLFGRTTVSVVRTADQAIHYIDGLKTRLRDAWHLAAERDVAAKVKGKTYFDKKAKSRRFEVGDIVLVMTPSMTGKLDDQWMGPYIIAEKMNDVTYKVHTPDRRGLFHVNGIKSWHTEPVAIMSVRFCEEDQVCDSQDPDVLPFEPIKGSRLTYHQRSAHK